MFSSLWPAQRTKANPAKKLTSTTKPHASAAPATYGTSKKPPAEELGELEAPAKPVELAPKLVAAALPPAVPVAEVAIMVLVLVVAFMCGGF